MADENQQNAVEDTDIVSDPQIFGMDVNYATQNKWYATYQLEDILGKKYNDINLHLKSFSLPQLMQSSTTVSFRGYEKEIPAKVLISGTKELTLEYIIDQNWKNYKALYALISGINGTLNPITTENMEGILPTQYLPLRVYLLGPYKKKIIQFVFENTWIKIFNELQLNMNSSDEVTHSFTVVFDQYRIEDV